MRWPGHTACMEELISPYKIVAVKSQRMGPLGRPGCILWEDNIKVNLEAIGCEGRSWIQLTYDKDQLWTLENTVKNIPVL